MMTVNRLRSTVYGQRQRYRRAGGLKPDRELHSPVVLVSVRLQGGHAAMFLARSSTSLASAKNRREASLFGSKVVTGRPLRAASCSATRRGVEGSNSPGYSS